MLSAYIEHDRNVSKSTFVFVDDKASFERLLSGNVLTRQLNKSFAELGFDDSSGTGAWIFRHAFSSNQLNAGKSLAQVANMLRHHRLTTTMIYARTDLRRCRPWLMTKGGRRVMGTLQNQLAQYLDFRRQRGLRWMSLPACLSSSCSSFEP